MYFFLIFLVLFYPIIFFNISNFTFTFHNEKYSGFTTEIKKRIFSAAEYRRDMNRSEVHVPWPEDPQCNKYYLS